MDVLVSHVNADFDSLGGLVAAQKLYPEAVPVLTGGAQRQVQEFLTLHRGLFDPRDPGEIDPETLTRIIVVDTSSRKRLGRAEAWLDLPHVAVHLFDHHTAQPPDFPTQKRRLEPVGSVSSILAVVLRDLDVTLSPFEATAMLLGIYEDTGSLTYAGTTPQDLEAAAWLLRSGGDLEVVSRFTRRSLSAEQRRLFSQMLAGVELIELGGATVALVRTGEGPYVEEAAVLLSRLMEAEEVDAAIALLPMAGVLYVIARSQTDALDIGELMRELGGGGHARAASATLKDGDADAVAEQVRNALPRFAVPEVSARSIMSYPARWIEPSGTIAEARRRMVKYGHSGLLVMEDGKLVGILTRRDVDKARHHRLEHAPVKGYMTRGVRTAAPETPLSELERLMIQDGIGRLPVVRDGEVLGIVTRSDVLKATHGARYLAGSHKERQEQARGYLRERLPAEVQRLLERVGRLAAGTENRVYAVGGFVRDLLLGVRNLDVDLLVEPDAVRLARALAEETDGELKVEERFGTAHVTLPRTEEDGLPDGFMVDFATARTESYARPGALPDIEHSSVVDDLRRRDFTINAMALSLLPAEYGELLDPFGGQEDLEHRRIRVLHNLSFTEDPTRLFRAVRFEERYQFQMDGHTQELALHSVQEGALAHISPERMRRELFNLFREAKPLGAIFRLRELGVLEWLCPGLVPSEELLRLVPSALEWFKTLARDAPEGAGLGRVNGSTVYLAAILAEAGGCQAERVAVEKLRLPPADAARIRQAIEAASNRAELLNPEHSPATVTASLKPLAPEGLTLLRAAVSGNPKDNQSGKPDQRKQLERYLKEWRGVRLEITGDDLKALGHRAGPEMGRALQATLVAKLNTPKSLQDWHAELAFAEAFLNGSAQAPSQGKG